MHTTKRPWLTWALSAVGGAGALLPLVLPACTLILGDDFEVQGPCDLLTFGTCGRGKKCSVVDVPSGVTGCVVAGPQPAWASCLGDTNCVEGTFCSIDGVCEPICAPPEDCANGGWCVEAYAGDWVQVPGLWVCTADCQPLTGAPCDASFGPVTCDLWAKENEFTCYSSGDYGKGVPCNPEQIDCGAGLACCLDAPTVCRRWCSPTGAQANCAAGQTCTGFSTPVEHDGAEYGLCY